VLSRRGFVTPEPHKRPKSSIIRFQADQPNERWQADITHWTLRSGYDVEIFNQLDDHSRLLVGSDTKTSFKAADIVCCFEQATTTYGTPASYLTDNAAVFTGAYRGLGWVALERELITRGVTLRHSRPYHPQTCGKVERFHQTLKKWLANQPRARTLSQLQDELDRFREYYNTVRPHRAIGRRTPQSAFQARPKAVPHDGPLALGHSRTRRDVVDTAGAVTRATTAAYITSASAGATPASASCSSSGNSTSASSPKTASCSEHSPSTRPRTTSPNPDDEL
jgi:transposase InsO family protein